jgi:cell shape-determining protein MreC
MSGTSNATTGDTTSERYLIALGAAAVDLWSHLPQHLQHTLFERAVQLGHKSERDESLREQLAKFLHDRHERTQLA